MRIDPPEDLDFTPEEVRAELDVMAAERTCDLTLLAEWLSECYAPSDALDAMSPTELNSFAASLYAERGKMWAAWRQAREDDACERLASMVPRGAVDDAAREVEECGQFYDGR